VAVSSSASASWNLPTEQIQTSADGITWTPVNVMVALTTTNAIGTYPPTIRSVTFGNGMFVAVGSDGVSNDAGIFTSVDGVTLVRQNARLPVGNGLSLMSVKFAGGQYIAVGWSGTVMTVA
jgi:hypothetical protein